MNVNGKPINEALRELAENANLKVIGQCYQCNKDIYKEIDDELVIDGKQYCVICHSEKCL